MFLSRVAVALVALSLGSVDASRCQPDPRSMSVTASSGSSTAASTGTFSSGAGDVSSTTLSATDGTSTTADTSSAAPTTSGTSTASIEVSTTKATTASGSDTATTLTTVTEMSTTETLSSNTESGTSEALSSTTLTIVTGTTTSEAPSSTTESTTTEAPTTAPTTTTEGPAAPTNYVKNYSFEDKDEQDNYVDSPWVVDGANATISHDGTASRTGQSAALFKVTDNTSRPKVRQLVRDLVPGEYNNIYYSFVLLEGTPPPNYASTYTVSVLGTPYSNQDYLRETHPQGMYLEYSNGFQAFVTQHDIELSFYCRAGMAWSSMKFAFDDSKIYHTVPQTT